MGGSGQRGLGGRSAARHPARARGDPDPLLGHGGGQGRIGLNRRVVTTFSAIACPLFSVRVSTTPATPQHAHLRRTPWRTAVLAHGQL
ncbi:hypothetical protein G6F59_018845 [Rhizopus arrhizus]|nr:hypothetical protein G6F59_018845 [Rhizopus arrhizus]